MRCGAVRCGAVRCGAVRCGAVRCGAVRCGAVRCGAVRCGAVRCGAVRCGAVRCGAVRCGAVRCGAGRCGAVRCVCSCACAVAKISRLIVFSTWLYEVYIDIESSIRFPFSVPVCVSDTHPLVCCSFSAGLHQRTCRSGGRADRQCMLGTVIPEARLTAGRTDANGQNSGRR